MSLETFRHQLESVSAQLKSNTNNIIKSNLKNRQEGKLQNFKSALKVALADGKINKDEQRKLDQIKDRNKDKGHDSFTPGRIGIDPNTSLSMHKKLAKILNFKDKGHDLYLEIVKLLKEGKRKKAEKLLKKLTKSQGGIIQFTIEDGLGGKTQSTNTSPDPLIDAYKTATADGSVSKAEAKVLKELVEA